MSCMFRAGGREFDVDAFLASQALQIYDVWRRGEPKGALGRRHPWSGFSVVASEAGMDDFAEQVQDAIEFLSEHAPILGPLASFPGWEISCLDFGIAVPSDGISSAHFPPALCRLAGEFGVGLEVSLY